MTPQFRQIEKQVLLLSPEEKEVLVERLLRSFHEEPPAEVDEAWLQEAERRYWELKEGRVEGIPGAHIFRRYQARAGMATLTYHPKAKAELREAAA